MSTDRAEAVLWEQQDADVAVKLEIQEKEVSDKMRGGGLLLAKMGIAGFVVLAGLTGLGCDATASYLLAKDVAVHGQIIPNRLTVLFTELQMAFLSMVVGGFSLAEGEYSGLLVLMVGCTIMLTILLREELTDVRIDGQYILICRFGKEWQHRMEDVHDVEWKSYRGIIGKQLVIYFHDGKSYWFNMEYHLGEQNAYHTLKSRLDDLSNDVRT